MSSIGHPSNVDLTAATAEFNRAKYENAKYREVYALLIDWEDDHMMVRGEMLTLERTLQEKYSATTQYFSIPRRFGFFLEAEDQGEILRAEVREFKRSYSVPDILLIICFT